MRVPFLDIKAQYNELAEQLDHVVLDVLRSGHYIMGPRHHALEVAIAELHGVKHGIGLNSGTDALHIMLDAAEIKTGDEVITCAFTFVSSVETIVQTGAKPVFVDVDPTTFMIDPDLIEAAITPRTKAIMPIHLFGQIAEMEKIQAIADKHGLLILEDSAQAIAATRNGIGAGGFGLCGAISFYVTKNLGAAGDAGMILTNDDDFAERCKSIRIHGMGRGRYTYDYVGYTSRLDEMQAGVLLTKLPSLGTWIEKRQANAGALLAELAGIPGLELPRTLPGNEHTYHQFTVRTERRDELREFLKAAEIDSMIYYPSPLHVHKPYLHYGGGEGSLPITEKLCRDVLSLPVHEHMSEEQVDYVAAKVKEFFGV